MELGSTRQNEEIFKQMKQLFRDRGVEITISINTPEAENKGEPVYWIEKPGIWGRFSYTKTGKSLQCLFGSHCPDKSKELKAEVEINLPYKGGKPKGSSIVENDGKIFLGRQGGLGGNIAKVSSEEFRRKIVGFREVIMTSGNPKTPYFLIGHADSERFLSDLRFFVAQCFRIRQSYIGLQPEDADEEAEPEDERSRSERQIISIKRRRGQQAFRDALINAYGGKCVISGCEVLDVLEAAHLKNYDGLHTNVLPNGLLLRADLHTLLDCNLLAIHPETRKVKFSNRASGSLSYKNFEGKNITEPNNPNHRPSDENLKSVFDKLK